MEAIYSLLLDVTVMNSVLVEKNEMSRLCPDGVNCANSVHITGHGRSLQHASALSQIHNGNILERNQVIIDYISFIMSSYWNEADVSSVGEFKLLFQGDDRPCDVRGVSWQIKKSYHDLTLLPDFYYVQQRGYRSFLPEGVLEWDKRDTRVLWRGGTTGGWNMDLDTALNLPRVKLCEIGAASRLPVDFGICNVVQAASDRDKEEIEAALKKGGLYKEFIDLEKFQSAKFFIQIDGNGNSWELVKKLRLGSCMLLVDSEWILWHNKILQPWIHYIPVRSDLVDLVDRIEWCLANDDQARFIADNARSLALGLRFDDEIRCAGEYICQASEEA